MASKTLAGQPVGQDERPIAMVFFASWCSHCREELVELAELRKQYPTLRVIGLNAYEEFRDFSDQERLRTYIADNAPWLTEIVEADENMRARFGNVPKIPTLIVYGGGGNVVAEFRREKGTAPTYKTLEQAIAKAVASE